MLGRGYICDRCHVLGKFRGVLVLGAASTFRVRASMDPASVALQARIAGYTKPHPEVKG